MLELIIYGIGFFVLTLLLLMRWQLGGVHEKH